MGLMVAYKRLKAVENYKTISPNSGPSHVHEVVNYQSFYCTALTGNIFDVLDKWLLVRGSCTWRFNLNLCNIPKNMVHANVLLERINLG